MENGMIDNYVPDEDDRALDALFQTMRSFSPHPGFEDRVMARVRTPSPVWLQRLQDWGRSIVESRRTRWVARGLVGSSVISITLVVSLLVTNGAEVSAFLGSQFGGVVLGVWRGALGLGSSVIRALYSAVGGGAVSVMALLAIAALGSLAMLFNTWALYRLMQPRGAARYSRDAVAL